MMKNIEKRISGRTIFLMSVIALIMLFSSVSCLAAAAASVTTQIPVRVDSSNAAALSSERYEVRITAEDEDAPMPSGGNALYITGAGTASFRIAYQELGVYHYTVSLVKGNNASCNYSTASYEVTVSVLQGEDAMSTSVVIEGADTNGKVSEASFTNSLKSSGDPTDPSTPSKTTTSKTSTSSPKTGDETPVYGMLLLLLAAACVIVLTGKHIVRESFR